MTRPQTFLLLLASLILATAQAQQADQKKPFSITGRVADSFTHTQTDSARITLLTSDSMTVLGTAVQELYGFTFTLARGGKYVLRYEAPHYQTLCRTVTLHFSTLRHTRQDIGTQLIHKEASPDVKLREAGVTATRIKMVMHGDTIVYDAGAFQLAEGSMLDALVRQLPGAEIRDGNRIYVGGRYVNSLLINGKDFFNGDAKMALDNLPAYTVGNIKVYEREQDNLRALGIVDKHAEKPYVMDVNLKRIYSFGWMANVETGAGADGRYAGRFFGMRFSDYSRIIAYGNANNVGDVSTAGTSGDWQADWSPQGVAAPKSAGVALNINDRQQRFEYRANVGYAHFNEVNRTSASKTRFLEGENSDARSMSRSDMRSNDGFFNQTLQIKPENSGMYFKVNSGISYRRGANFDHQLTANFSANPVETYRCASLDSLFARDGGSAALRRITVNQMKREAESHQTTYKGSLQLNAQIKIAGTNDNIGISVDLNGERETSDSYVRSLLKQSSGQDLRHEYIDGPSRRYDFDVGGYYNYRLSLSRWYVGFIPQLRYLQRYVHAPQSRYRLDRMAEDAQAGLTWLPSVGDSLLDFDNSYRSTELNKEVHAVANWDIVYTLSKGKEAARFINLILYLEQSFKNQRLSYERALIDTTFHRSHSALNPNVRLRYVKAGDSGVELSYSAETNLPPMTWSLRYTDTSNPLVSYEYKGGVKNQRAHHLELSYHKFNEKKARTLDVELGYNVSTNDFCQAMIYDRQTGLTTYRPTNVCGNWNANIRVNYACPLDRKKRFTLSTNTNPSYYHSVDLTTTSTQMSSSRSVVHNAGWNEQLAVEYRKGLFSLELGGRINMMYVTSPREGFETIHCADFSYGLSGQMPLPMGVEWSTDLKMYSRRGYRDATMNTNQLIWNAQLSKTVIKNRLTLRLSAYDILDKTSNISRTLTPQGRTETWHNALNRYVMLHVIYRLSVNPKKKI